MENKETLSKHIEDIPKLRFSWFSGAYKKNLIEDICDISTGKSNTKDQDINGRYPFYIRSNNPVKSNKYLYDCEAVITAGDGDIGKIFHYIKGKFDLHQRCYKMSNFKNMLGKYFYYYFSKNFSKRVSKMSAKATVDSVRMNMISEMVIYYPELLSEQEEVVNFFTKIDNCIDAQEKLLTLLNKYKEGLLSIFFDNIPKEWIDYKLKEISHIKSGEFVIKSKQNSNGRYPVYNGGTTYTGFYDNYNNRGNKIVISARGNAGYVNFVEKDFWAGNSCYVIESKYNIKFLYYQIKYKQNSLYKMQQLATIPSILKKDIEDIDLYIPSIEEQTKIAKILSTYDSLIDKETQILNQLKLMKSGLLQQMFI